MADSWVVCLRLSAACDIGIMRSSAPFRCSETMWAPVRSGRRVDPETVDEIVLPCTGSKGGRTAAYIISTCVFNRDDD